MLENILEDLDLHVDAIEIPGFINELYNLFTR